SLLPRSTLFPYTTLFRSSRRPVAAGPRSGDRSGGVPGAPDLREPEGALSPGGAAVVSQGRKPLVGIRNKSKKPRRGDGDRRPSRSEEHTSELQSPYDLVC